MLVDAIHQKHFSTRKTVFHDMKFLLMLFLTSALLFSNSIFGMSSDFTLATAKWEQASYSSNAGTHAVVTVTDPDMNKHPEVIDYIWTTIHSDSDPDIAGTKMNLFETGFDTGIFKKEIIFSATPPSGQGFLHVVSGDTIFVKYLDTTVPANYTLVKHMHKKTENGIEVRASAVTGLWGPPMERAPASNFMVLDIRKTPIENNLIAVDQQIRLVSDLENQMSRIQPFAYLVQIQNEQNQVESLSWLTGNLTASQKINLGTTWIPIKEGKYFATVFVWESIDNPTALSPPLPLEIFVKNEN